MVITYPAQERHTESGSWGTSQETFFASEQEKYLGFGDLVQLTHSVFREEGGRSGMKLHRNSELVDIILNGSVGYQDSSGSISVFPSQTVQVVSAGQGLYQSEFNAGSGDAELLRIGFLPGKLNTPAIKTKALFDLHSHNDSLVELVSPSNPASLTVNQQAAVLLGTFEEGRHVGYALSGRSVGLFVYVVHGTVTIHQQLLHSGDALAIHDEGETMIHTAAPSTLLVIEISMNE